jgi:IPT/TIG domain/WD40-like Beta Propeller Repeat
MLRVRVLVARMICAASSRNVIARLGVGVPSALAGVLAAVLLTAAVPAEAIPNGKIAFRSSRAPADGSAPDIYTLNPDESGLVGPLTSPFTDSDPAFSPDGKLIAWSTFEFAGNPCCESLAIMNADGSNRHLVINGTNTESGVAAEAAWSPDGTELAFVYRDKTLGNQIARVKTNGGGFTPLTAFGAGSGTQGQRHPTWSPDGLKIAYASDRTGGFEIYKMNAADGSSDERLTTSAPGQGSLDPAWSPDGATIAFYGQPAYIFFMNPDGSNRTQRTFVGPDIQPTWSPDGTKIAFTRSSDGPGNAEIYTMVAADSSNQTRLTNNEADDSQPTWGRIPAPAVTKLKPTSGPTTGGTTVTISGTFLAGASAVAFGASPATSFSTKTVKGVTSVTAVSPVEPAGTVDVTVTTPGGTSAIVTNDRFKFLPTITGVSPNSGSKTGGASVTITGTGFGVGKTATVLKFGTIKATSVNCSSDTTCTVIAPAHAVGTVDVKATVNKVSSAKNAPADQYTFN